VAEVRPAPDAREAHLVLSAASALAGSCPAAGREALHALATRRRLLAYSSGESRRLVVASRPRRFRRRHDGRARRLRQRLDYLRVLGGWSSRQRTLVLGQTHDGLLPPIKLGPATMFWLLTGYVGAK
jgi:hypothetical protein